MKIKANLYYLGILLSCLLFSCSEKEEIQRCMDCPVVTYISKPTARVNDSLTIRGTNFAESGNRVFFSGKEAKTAYQNSTSIVAYVPSSCGTGPVTVERPDKRVSNDDKIFKEIYTFQVTTYAGQAGSAGWWDGPITYVFFNGPSAITMDAENNLIICDEGNYCVRKIANGSLVTIAGKHGTAGFQNSPDAMSALFNTPRGLAITNSNSFYISDNRNHSIRNYSPIGFVTQACGNPRTPGYQNGTGVDAAFNYPGRMLMLNDQTFLIADSANHRIRKADIQGEVTLFAGNGSIGAQNGNVLKASFNDPRGMTFYDPETILITEAGNSKIRKINLATSEVTDFAGYGKSGFANGDVNKAMFNNPSGIAVRVMNGKREVFIADTDNNMIRMIDPDNNVTTVIGDLQPGSVNSEGIRALMNGPADLVFDRLNNAILYISDKRNHTIRKVIID